MTLIVSGASPYPSVTTVMNMARVRVNDAANDIAGDLLADDQPYTLTLLNTAWRWLQTKASGSGIETLIAETAINGFPASTDLTLQSWIGPGGAGAGGLFYQQPRLPADIINPMNVWVDRGDGNYGLMRQADSGLPVWQDTSTYDWRTNQMWFWGSNQPINFRIRYSAALAPLVLGDPSAVAQIMYCEDALSARLAYEFAFSRGSAQSAALAAVAEDAFQQLANRTGRKNQRRNLRRLPFSGNTYSQFWPY